MQHDLKKKIKSFAKQSSVRKAWQRIVSGLTCIVVFCTTYALILPAITMEGNSFCGIEDHIHGEECYSAENTMLLVCNPVHSHGAACYTAEGSLGCNRADFVLHTHSDICYNTDGSLLCRLPQVTEQNGENGVSYLIEGMQVPVTDAHIHSDACYAVQRGTLQCTLTEGEAHVHDAAVCYGAEEVICGQDEWEAHAHEDSCYGEAVVSCGLEEQEGHAHHDGCYSEPVQTCTLDETAGHTHSEACYGEKPLICQVAEGEEHSHDDSCYGEATIGCGQEEIAAHTHDDSCYTKNLICEQEEREAHAHTEGCYTKPLICTLPEGEGHTHDESCKQIPLVCTISEEVHTHSDACYEAVNVLSCGKLALQEHIHTEACLQQKPLDELLICEKQEHTHTLICFSDKEADLENEQRWMASMNGVALNGTDAENLLTIAKTQLGYQESGANYTVLDDGITIKGYNRYGVWAGDPYADWNELFVEFCLHYAGISAEEFPWKTAAKIQTREPNAGDLIFLDIDNTNYVGIVASVKEEYVTAILGDYKNEVRSETFTLSDVDVLGYVAMPQKAASQLDGNANQTAAITEEILLSEVVQQPMLSSDNEEVGAQESNTIPVTGISGTGTTYDPKENAYTTDVKIDFEFQKANTQSGVEYVYTYPEGIKIPSDQVGKKLDLYDGQIKAGTYEFVKIDDDSYSVIVILDKSYVDNAGNKMIGNIVASGSSISEGHLDNSGNIVLGEDDVILTIPSTEIKYPEGETRDYDMSTQKSGGLNYNNGKLEYTVIIDSQQGTPDPIYFEDTIKVEDTITENDVTLETPSVTVQKGTYKSYNEHYTVDNNDWAEVEVTPIFKNNIIEMTLFGLPAGEPKVDSNNSAYTERTRYKVTYSYDVDNLPPGSYTVGNMVKTTATGNGQTVTDTATTNPVTISKELTLDKNASIDYNAGKISWSITLNNNKINIAGAVLTDTMFGSITSGTNVAINPNSGYEIQSDGSIKFTEVAEGKNKNTYTITYTTDVPANWDEIKQKNTATIDPTPNNPGDEIKKEKEVTINGGSVGKESGEGTVSQDGKTADVSWTVTVNTPLGGLPAGTEIKDTLQENQWFTQAQLAVWNGNVTWNNGGAVDSSKLTITVKDTNGNSYSYADVRANVDGQFSNMKFTEISIVPTETISRPQDADKLSFTIHSTADLTKGNSTGSVVFKNKVQVGNSKDEADYTYDKGSFEVDKEMASSNVSEDKTSAVINWDITVTIPNGKLPAGTEILDQVIGDGHYITREQAIAWENQNLTWNDSGNTSLDKSNYTVTYTGSDGKTYNSASAIPEDTTINKVSIKINNNAEITPPDGATQLKFTIPTTADLTIGNEGTLTYSNKVTVDGKEDTDNFIYDKGSFGIVKTADEESVTVNPDGKTATVDWNIVVTTPDGSIPGNTVIEDSLWNSNNLQITKEQIVAWEQNPHIFWDDNTALPEGSYTLSYQASNGQIYSTAESIPDGATVKMISIKINENGISQPGATQLNIRIPTTIDIQGEGKVTYSNNASLNNDHHYTGSLEFDKGNLDVVKTKGNVTENADGTHTVNWTVSVSMPVSGLAKDTVIGDTLYGNGHYITKAQAQAWSGTLTWTNDTVIPADCYSITFHDANGSYSKDNIPDGAKLTRVEIKLNKNLLPPATGEKSFSFSIDTTADVGSASLGNNVYTNTAWVGQKNSSVNYEYNRGEVTVQKTAGDLQFAEDRKTATVDWTIEIGVPELGLPNGTKIEDSLSQTNHFITSEQANAWNPSLVWKDEHGNVKGILDSSKYSVTFKSPENANSDGKFTGFTITMLENIPRPEGATKLTFTAPTTVDIASSSFGQNTYVNTAKVGNTQDSEEIRYEKPNLQLEKNLLETPVISAAETAVANWKVDITVPVDGLPKNLVLRDTLTSNQWFTQAQIAAWDGKLTWEDNATQLDTNLYSITFKDSNGTPYSYDTVKANANGSMTDIKFTSIEITLNGHVVKPANLSKLSFTIASTLNIKDAQIGMNTYGNKIESNGVSAEDKFEYRKGGVVKTDGNWQTGKSSTTSDGTLYWKVKVTTDDRTTTFLKVTDTLPEGVEVESIALEGGTGMNLTIAADGTISGENQTYSVTGMYDKTKREVVLTLVPKDTTAGVRTNTEFVFSYTCKVTDNTLKNGVVHPLKNSVTVENNLGALGNSSQTQEWTYDDGVQAVVIGKTGVWDNNNRKLNYSVVLNSDGEDLVEGTDTLTLTDELTYSPSIYAWYEDPNDPTKYEQGTANLQISLVQPSVKLYRAVKNGNEWTKGEEVTDWIWTYSTEDYEYQAKRTITAQVPDSESLILEYTYQMTSDVPEGWKFNLQGINNNAKLKGRSENSSDNMNDQKWDKPGTTGQITTEKNFTIYKVETGNYNASVPGAKFSVYAYDSATNAYGTDVVREYTTDSYGMLQVKWNEGTQESPVYPYQYNTLYKIVETEAPSGYKLPDEPVVNYFYFSNSSDTTHKLPSSLPGSAVDLSSSSDAAYIENTSNDISVQKKWVNSEGTAITPSANQQIVLKLYQRARLESSGGSSGGGTGASITYEAYGRNDLDAGKGVIPNAQIGSTIKITITLAYEIGKDWTWTPNVAVTGVTGSGSWQYPNPSVYTFTGTVTGNVVIRITDEDSAKLTVAVPEVLSNPSTGNTSGGGSPIREDSVVREVTLNAVDYHSSNWFYTFKHLPLSGIENNQTVYYSYYVVEERVSNFIPSYSNNGGVTSGTIVITNTQLDTPVYELPETGGAGTFMYTLSGLVLCGTAALGYNHKKRRKEDHSS